MLILLLIITINSFIFNLIALPPIIYETGRLKDSEDHLMIFLMCIIGNIVLSFFLLVIWIGIIVTMAFGRMTWQEIWDEIRYRIDNEN